MAAIRSLAKRVTPWLVGALLVGLCCAGVLSPGAGGKRTGAEAARPLEAGMGDVCRGMARAAAALVEGLVNHGADAILTWDNTWARGIQAAAKGEPYAFNAGNVAVFTLAIAALATASWFVLRSPLALLTVIPLLLTASLAHSVAIGQDTLFMCVSAAALLLWLWMHQRGTASSWRGILAFVALCGISQYLSGSWDATPVSETPVIFAYALYLAFASGRRGRVTKAAAVGLVGLIAYVLVDPTPLYDPRGFAALAANGYRLRLAHMTQMSAVWGPMTWTGEMAQSLSAWPVLVALVAPVWLCRREAWFAPVAWWAAALVIGALAGFSRVDTVAVEYALYYTAALSAAAVWKARTQEDRKAGLAG